MATNNDYPSTVSEPLHIQSYKEYLLPLAIDTRLLPLTLTPDNVRKRQSLVEKSLSTGLPSLSPSACPGVERLRSDRLDWVEEGTPPESTVAENVIRITRSRLDAIKKSRRQATIYNRSLRLGRPPVYVKNDGEYEHDIAQSDIAGAMNRCTIHGGNGLGGVSTCSRALPGGRDPKLVGLSRRARVTIPHPPQDGLTDTTDTDDQCPPSQRIGPTLAGPVYISYSSGPSGGSPSVEKKDVSKDSRPGSRYWDGPTTIVEQGALGGVPATGDFDADLPIHLTREGQRKKNRRGKTSKEEDYDYPVVRTSLSDDQPPTGAIESPTQRAIYRDGTIALYRPILRRKVLRHGTLEQAQCSLTNCVWSSPQNTPFLRQGCVTPRSGPCVCASPSRGIRPMSYCAGPCCHQDYASRSTSASVGSSTAGLGMGILVGESEKRYLENFAKGKPSPFRLKKRFRSLEKTLYKTPHTPNGHTHRLIRHSIEDAAGKTGDALRAYVRRVKPKTAVISGLGSVGEGEEQ